MSLNKQMLTEMCMLYIPLRVFGTKSISVPYKLGAKNTPTDIQDYIESNCNSNMTTSEIQNFANANISSCGVDCTGFAYFTLNEASGGAVMDLFGVSYAYGVHTMTFFEYYAHQNGWNPTNGTFINKASDVVPGTVMCTANGEHILVVYDVRKNSSGKVDKIYYAHSNGSKGPHFAYITITDDSQDLDHSSQTWHDIAYTDSQAKGYYNYSYMLNCLK